MSSGLPIRSTIPFRAMTHPGSFGPWAVGRQLFADHMDKLVELGYTGLSIGQLMNLIRAGRPGPDKTVLVTFDDGFADFAKCMAAMKEGGFRHFVCHCREWWTAGANGSSPLAPANFRCSRASSDPGARGRRSGDRCTQHDPSPVGLCRSG